MSSDALEALKKLRFEIPKPPAFTPLSIPKSPLVAAAEGNLASRFYQHLGEMIQEFDAALDESHEVGARLVSFGSAVTFHITGLGFQNPSLIIFGGELDDGSPVQLIQHVSQISVLLTSLPKIDPNQPKRRFGFAPVRES